MNKLIVDTYAEATRIADEKEAEGFEYVAVTTNVDRDGRLEVKWGDVKPRATHLEIMGQYQEMFESQERLRNEEFEEKCRLAGRKAAAAEFAAQHGYTGRDADVFIDGFNGVSAKVTNPRAEGREEIFREGRTAYGSQEGQRAMRAASVKARSTVKRAPKFQYSEGLIANGEYD